MVKKIAVIYTGGTIGMGLKPGKTVLTPQPLAEMEKYLPFLTTWQSGKHTYDGEFLQPGYRTEFDLWSYGEQVLNYPELFYTPPNPEDIWLHWQAFAGHHPALDWAEFLQPNNRLSSTALSHFEVALFSWLAPLDSSAIQIADWEKLGHQLERIGEDFDAFVIAHGTDTLSYSASATSFIFQGWDKKIVFTGAEWPVAKPQSDGVWNLFLALRWAAEPGLGTWVVFGDKILPATRTSKSGGGLSYFEANKASVRELQNSCATAKAMVIKDRIYKKIFHEVYTILLQPTLSPVSLETLLQLENFSYYLLLCYGSGNFPIGEQWKSLVRKALDAGKIIVFISQCPKGQVGLDYATSFQQVDPRLISGRDLSPEAAVTKMAWVAAHLVNQGSGKDSDTFRTLMHRNLVGEISA